MIKYELINFCEFDKYATKSYCAVHNESESKNLGDITKVNEKEIADFNMMTWGFPCTDISVAGKQSGFIDEEGNQTRSGLYYEGLRILREKKPALSIIENVKNLIGTKFKAEFEQILSDIDNAGYNTYWKVLNAKNFGVPQNRERVFIISVRKDLDNGKFKFPTEFDNGTRLKHFLETEVDEKYYISQEKTEKLISQLKDKSSLVLDMCQSKREGKPREYTDFMPTLNARDYKEPRLINQLLPNECECVGRIDIKGHDYIKRVYSPDGLAPTIPTCCGGNHEPKIITVGQISNEGSQAGKVYDPDGLFPTVCACTHGYAIGNIIEEVGIIDDQGRTKKELNITEHCPTLRAQDHGNPPKVVNGCSFRTRNYMNQPQQLEVRKDELSNSITTVQKDSMAFIVPPKPELVGGIGEINFGKQYRQGNRIYSSEKTAMCLMAQPVGNTGGNSYLYEIDYRIRKLIPLECWRLMGFDNEDFHKAKNDGLSDTQLYKQAGNSIVVDVLYYILLEIHKVMPYLLEDIKLSSFFSGIGAFEKAIERLMEEVNKTELH